MEPVVEEWHICFQSVTLFSRRRSARGLNDVGAYSHSSGSEYVSTNETEQIPAVVGHTEEAGCRRSRRLKRKFRDDNEEESSASEEEVPVARRSTRRRTSNQQKYLEYGTDSEMEEVEEQRRIQKSGQPEKDDTEYELSEAEEDYEEAVAPRIRMVLQDDDEDEGEEDETEDEELEDEALQEEFRRNVVDDDSEEEILNHHLSEEEEEEEEEMEALPETDEDSDGAETKADSDDSQIVRKRKRKRSADQDEDEDEESHKPRGGKDMRNIIAGLKEEENANSNRTGKEKHVEDESKLSNIVVEKKSKIASLMDEAGQGDGQTSNDLTRTDMSDSENIDTKQNIPILDTLSSKHNGLKLDSKNDFPHVDIKAKQRDSAIEQKDTLLPLFATDESAELKKLGGRNAATELSNRDTSLQPGHRQIDLPSTALRYGNIPNPPVPEREKMPSRLENTVSMKADVGNTSGSIEASGQQQRLDPYKQVYNPTASKLQRKDAPPPLVGGHATLAPEKLAPANLDIKIEKSERKASSTHLASHGNQGLPVAPMGRAPGYLCGTPQSERSLSQRPDFIPLPQQASMQDIFRPRPMPPDFKQQFEYYPSPQNLGQFPPMLNQYPMPATQPGFYGSAHEAYHPHMQPMHRAAPPMYPGHPRLPRSSIWRPQEERDKPWNYHYPATLPERQGTKEPLDRPPRGYSANIAVPGAEFSNSEFGMPLASATTTKPAKKPGTTPWPSEGKTSSRRPSTSESYAAFQNMVIGQTGDSQRKKAKRQ